MEKPALMFVFLSLMAACSSPDYLPEKELQSFLLDEDHGLMKTVESNGIDVRLVYRPTDMLVAQELRGEEKPTSEQIDKARKKYDSHGYFLLSLSSGNHEVITPAALGQNRFSDMLQTVSFRMGQYVNLTTPAKDTIAVADYVYNRTFGMAQASELLLVFSKEKWKDQPWIQFNLAEFGLGLGNRQLRFEMDEINNAPKIYHQ